MPELPEVETMVRGIRPFVEGRQILAVRRCRCACAPLQFRPGFATLAKRMRDRTVVGVRRIAKRIVIDLNSGDSLVIEPRMTGLILLADAPDRAHRRFEIRFAGQREYNSITYWDRRGLGTAQLMREDELAERLGPTKLGPDALSMSSADWQERCTLTKRPVKVALLDQKWIAGIGNLYASEILHLAGIHPGTSTAALSSRQILRLADSTQTVLSEAIAYEGSTLNDETYRNVLNRRGRYQSRHRVYGKQGERCFTCGEGIVERMVQSQRSTFFCPVCQPPEYAH